MIEPVRRLPDVAPPLPHTFFLSERLYYSRSALGSMAVQVQEEDIDKAVHAAIQ
jgi:hypothetical protein